MRSPEEIQWLVAIKFSSFFCETVSKRYLHKTLVTMWKVRTGLQRREQIVLELQQFEISEVGECVPLDEGDLALGKIESLQLLEFEEGVAGNLSYGVPPQVEHHQVAAVGQSLLGDVVEEVPAEVHLGKLRLI